MDYKITKKPNKIKQKRRRIALAILIFFITFIIYLIVHPRDYQKQYERDEYQILEIYDKALKAYTYQIQKEDQTYVFLTNEKYSPQKERIKSIETLEEENTHCIIPTLENQKIYPQCFMNGTQVDYHLVPEKMKEHFDEALLTTVNAQTNTYERIDIKNIDDVTYYVWNYKGFYKINKKETKTIPLFEEDVYDISNVIKANDYIIIPDYHADFYLNKLYLLNTKDDKLTTWEFKDTLYHDGYNLGVHKNAVYYVDKKNNIEWEINPKKKKMTKIGTNKKDGKIWNNGKWENIQMNELVNETHQFSDERKYTYQISQGLYVTYQNSENKKLISTKEIKEIVYTIEDKVYYLAGDTLYAYSEQQGEVPVLSYFEWNFNYHNMIFIKED